ncbi:N-acetylgalactosamine 6-sulfate sulfatase [Prolixibacteraceae bacterium JC049]|nr:N-acetylgalactosamine 6-sulfate sulfatase [Prolixibacteraceae bacterium JC049]
MCVGGTFAHERKKSEDRPNVILIMADDLGWGDTGYNGNPVIKTPYLDQMANEGIRFNRFYSVSAVCSPTRCSVLTGRNPFRSGVFHANQGILRPEEVTIPELLKEKGYSTGHFGKWHLGTLTHQEKDANRGRVGNTREYNPPALHGYDQAFVTESKVPTWDPMKKPVGKVSHLGWNALEEDDDWKPYGTHYWDIDGNKVTDNLDGDDSRVIMDRVLPFINKSVKQEKPFFAVVWFHTPHLPCVAGPEYREMYKGQSELMQNYAGCITAMDDQIGRLRSYLQQLNVDENTMIWFCSDNGPERNTPGITAGYRERKRSLHEGGVRVPGVMVWPQRVKKNRIVDFPAVTSDYLPTIAEVLNIKAKKMPNQLDGISLLPLIDGKQMKRKSPIGFCYPNQVSLSGDRYKVYARNGKLEFYDIINDPYEKKSLSNHREMEKMQKEMREFVKSCKESFDGKEYGTKSYDKLNQKWKNPYGNEKKK